jgi:rhodanese-related sulfurtransferase
MAIFIAFTVNLVAPHRIPLIGHWPSVSGSDTVVVPPSADEGDPPFVSLDEAATKYQMKSVLFIDARDPEDYEYAHIKGAINIAYDYLEEDFWENPPEIFDKYRGFVIYCSGTECDLSLMMGREMQYLGYENIFIFFGGWREWERAGLPIVSGGDGG